MSGTARVRQKHRCSRLTGFRTQDTHQAINELPCWQNAALIKDQQRLGSTLQAGKGPDLLSGAGGAVGQFDRPQGCRLAAELEQVLAAAPRRSGEPMDQVLVKDRLDLLQ